LYIQDRFSPAKRNPNSSSIETLDEMAENTREGELVGRLEITSPHNKRSELLLTLPSITEPRAF
jgi:hypothetical protein